MGTQLSDFTFTFHFHALEKEMATHSSVLAWRIPGTAEPGGLLSMGSHRDGHDWSDLAAAAAAAISQIERVAYSHCGVLNGGTFLPEYCFNFFTKRFKIDIGIQLFKNKSYMNWCVSVLPPCQSPSRSASKIKCKNCAPPVNNQDDSFYCHPKKNQNPLEKRMTLELKQGIKDKSGAPCSFRK